MSVLPPFPGSRAWARGGAAATPEGLAGVLPPAGLGTPLSPGFPPAQEALGPAAGWQLRLTRVTCSFFSFFFFFPYIFL